MTLQEIQYKAQAIMQKWRDEDSAPYVEFVEELALMNVPELPDGLEEAADSHIRKVIDAAGHPGWDWETQDIAEAFKAGAKWDQAKMLEGAVEGKVFMSFAPGHNQMVMADVDLPTNTKVKVIIVKEDEK